MNSFMHAMTRESQLPIITFMRQGTSQEWEGMSGFCCQRRYTQFPFMATNTSISDIYDQSKTQRTATFGTKQGAANHQSLPWPLTSSLDIIQTHSWHEWEKKLHVPKCLLSPRMNWPTSMTAQRGGKNCQRWVRNRRKLWRQTKQNWLCFAKEFLPTWAVISLQR